VHKIFWQIATLGLPVWRKIPQANLTQQWTMLLLANGIPKTKLTESLTFIQQVITKTLADPMGCWLLADTHQAAKAEWALTAIFNGQPKQVVIDRTFIDQEGIRWLVDYKIHYQQAATDLVRPEYITQLKLYQQILQLLSPNTIIKAVLYFPLQTKNYILDLA
jgi:hypothetical protein